MSTTTKRRGYVRLLLTKTGEGLTLMNRKQAKETSFFFFFLFFSVLFVVVLVFGGTLGGARVQRRV
jgi:hypothetical protein